MAQASFIAAWAMLFFKLVGVIACAVVLLGLFWAIRTRRTPPNKDDDIG